MAFINMEGDNVFLKLWDNNVILIAPLPKQEAIEK